MINHETNKTKELAVQTTSWTSEHRIKHRLARYVLTQKQPIEV